LAKKALPVLGLDPSFPFPSYASKPLSKLLPRNQGEKPEALLFGGCFLEYNDPGPALAIIKVLGAAGVKTKAAEPVCCGLPSLIKGDKARAERVAKKSLSRLAPVLEGFEGPLLFASPSCLWMAREFWPLLVKTPQAAKVASQAAEAGAFLLSLAQSGKLPKFSRSNRLLAYQAPCHLALSQAPWPAFDLIGLIEGARLFDLGQGCCGQGGTYGMEAANASVAKAASEKLSRALAERPYEAVVSECEACRMRLGAVSGLKTLHPFEVLAEAL
jgi:glycerol-3-phosphate dehydrogenase subunit C